MVLYSNANRINFLIKWGQPSLPDDQKAGPSRVLHRSWLGMDFALAAVLPCILVIREAVLAANLIRQLIFKHISNIWHIMSWTDLLFVTKEYGV